MKKDNLEFKECRVCKKNLTIDCFRVGLNMKSGIRNECRKCEVAFLRASRKTNGYNEKQRLYRKTRVFYSKKYNSSEKRKQVLNKHMSTFKAQDTKYYLAMLDRINNRRTYKGKGICSKEEFFVWTDENRKEYIRLKEQWVSSGKLPKFRVTIDRIDNDKGYLIGNIRWCSLSENSTKSNK